MAAARRVQGLYTVPVVDADLRADEPWLATAYVPGPSLHDAVAECGPLPVDAAVGLIAHVAEALQSIHAADVIHRDLKPSNIILTPEGPKVIDFGIARATDVTSVTRTGMLTGTPAYMAPEYIKGQTVTEAVDVFAFGVVARFAATGRPAFGGGSHHSVTYRILEQAPDLDDCPEPVRTIAAGGDGRVQLWGVASRKRRATFTQREKSGTTVVGVPCLAFSPNGQLLAIGTDRGEVGLWDVAKRRQVARIPGDPANTVNSVAFSPDGKTLAVGSGEEGCGTWPTANNAPA
ncbi:WD40 repeat domain-containing serine/threonine protein kinase [Streptomyces sp. R41]|uniref:WD40 repeat domain-containing serine/threonine protein kinase n=1 Tax=Streptomyces sp. R41 TaxID=3238632 RepID=A0AB39RPR2_9ACTN